ncbi:MAG: alpha/beta hydrolase [Acidobacteriota bacterium]|nr:alpha/beta hydrolase [Acidobacteriota bacterium]MDH3522897.1 alpha/beta hydrolase [Acidobacteriota bacterium]
MRSRRIPRSPPAVLGVAILVAGHASISAGPLDNTRRLGLPEGVLEASVHDAGPPAVVFESGAGAACKMGNWAQVIDLLRGEATLFAYNRSGYGGSRIRRDLDDPGAVVEVLRRGLAEAGVAPPYVLVGHSLGGVYMNLFARLHPDEVAGLVLVDSSHPGQFDDLREDKPLRYAMMVAGYTKGPPKVRYELANMNRIRREIESAGPFPDVPLVVLTAGKSPSWQKEAEREWWLGLQSDLASLSPRSRSRIVESSGHFIQRDRPAEVADAIREILAVATARGSEEE